MYLLDTNVISELRRGKKGADPGVQRWAAGVAAAQMFLSAITILEIEQGILLKALRDPNQAEHLRTWFEAVRQLFAGRVLPFGEGAALVCAALHVPNPRSERDAMIAATASEHGFTLVTRNVADFIGSGVPLLNPWDVTDLPVPGARGSQS
ncbi:type II toxin-antitoxin system VapC family toxin [Sphaerotilus microaerophilus]|mgnify:CR=1 FL=1|jgi:hypothetical protein|uniref:Ribonuclease VapC n=1 Tax=Sphaerotilus microaerophilus TaxID=2914710 RepID=A0ABM7YL06_9BURK|nr:type II toxin-antitoxin system VapC family toxin [Sphaerotilus sp. FB-5]BDI05035.1 twitching motility protein PilT [Sphaerotilus sp. FB-5]